MLTSRIKRTMSESGHPQPIGKSPTPAEIFSTPDHETVVRPAPDVRTLALVVLVVIGCVFVLQFAQDVFIPIVLGVLVSTALEPIVALLTRFKVPRALGAAVVLVVIAGVIGYGAYSLSDEAMQLIDSLPSAAQQIRQAIRSARGGSESVIEKVQRAATELEQTAKEAEGDHRPPPGVTRVQIEEKPIDVHSYLRWGGSSIVVVLTQIGLVFFFVYFLLVSGDLFRRKIVKIAGPSLEKRKVTVAILGEINTQIERFLIVQVLACVVVTILSAIAFMWAGLEHAILWAVLAGLLVSIPYFGALILTVLVGMAAFLQFGTVGMGLWIAGLSFAIRAVETFLLTPWLMGRAARMSGVAVFAGLLFWGWMWGVWGMLLAVPIMMAVKATCDRIDGLEPVGKMLGD